MNTPNAAARLYIDRGYSPIPVPPRSKRPTRNGWPTLRIAPPDVDAYFPAQQETNVGLLLGDPSGGLVDIDLDCREALAAAPFLMLPTDMLSGRASAGGRSHWWYAVEAAPKKAADEFTDPVRATDADPAVRKKALLVELRSTGGQTVVPPSVYPADDEHAAEEPCVWRRGDLGEPGRVPVADVRAATGAVAAAALLGRYWPRSRRHACALSLAGGLLRRWPVGRVEAFVRAVCAAASDEEADLRVRDVYDTAAKLAAEEHVTGFPNLVKELGANGATIMEAVGRWLALPKREREPSVQFGAPASAKPSAPTLSPLPAWRPFPTDLLPAAVRDFVATVATAMRCDPSYVALPALSVCAGMVGATRVVRLKHAWHEPAMGWTAVVGESGTLKTPPYRRAIAPVVALQLEHLKEHRAAMEAYRVELREYERAKKKCRDEDPGDPPVEPVAVRIYSRDTTVEALAGLLTNNRDRFLVGRDELSGWLSSFNQYKSKGGSDLANWLELHGLGTLCVDRKTGEPKTIFVSGVGVSVCGGIQPGVLREALSAQHFSAGIPARLLFAYPPRQPKVWTEDDIDGAAEARYTRLVRALAALQPDAPEEEGGETDPVVVKLPPDAKAEWVAFYRRFARRQAEADGDLAAAFSKLEGYAARLSLLHHVCAAVDAGGDGTADVAVESVRAGIGLAEWFTYEAERVYQMLGEDRPAGQLRTLFERVCRLAAAHGGRVTARQLQNSNSRKYRRTEDADAALSGLVAAGLGTWEDVPTTHKGGHPSRAFAPLPTSDTSDTTPPGGAGDGVGDGPPASDTTPPRLTQPAGDGTTVGCEKADKTSESASATAHGTPVVSEVSDVGSGDGCGQTGGGRSEGGSVGRGGVVSDADDLPYEEVL